jgi:hypothetical protein
MDKKFSRKCPTCGKCVYHTDKKNRNRFEKEKRRCYSCSSIERCSRVEIAARMSEIGKTLVGEKNPFYGKHHTDEAKCKIAENADRTIYKTDKFKQKMSDLTLGEKNPMAGKTVYGVWVDKYGKEEADRLRVVKYEKASGSLSGSNNPMYGKPAPKRSGCGWSGWLDGFYFRSLRELAYILKLKEEKTPFVTGEKKCYSIEYNDNGKNRTYRADFFVDGRRLVEIKPIKLQKTVINEKKQQIAIEHCVKNGWQYEIIDIEPVPLNQLIELSENGKLKLTSKWKKKLCSLNKKLQSKNSLPWPKRVVSTK